MPEGFIHLCNKNFNLYCIEQLSKPRRVGSPKYEKGWYSKRQKQIFVNISLICWNDVMELLQAFETFKHFILIYCFKNHNMSLESLYFMQKDIKFYFRILSTIYILTINRVFQILWFWIINSACTWMKYVQVIYNLQLKINLKSFRRALYFDVIHLKLLIILPL